MSRLATSVSSRRWRLEAVGAAVSALLALVLLCVALVGEARAQNTSGQGGPEKRIAFVVGNAAYTAGALPTTANDAGLIAQTLQAAGFDVIGARDLDHNGLSDAMRDFLGKASAAGPDAVVFVYLAGYGLQYQGDNYFLPVDAEIANATDVPIQAMRLSDFTKSLATLKNHGSIVVLDAARSYPFPQSVSGSQSGAPELAGGLALVDPDPNQLIAFNAAPGTVAPQENGPYGAYAHALAEMIRTGGLPLADVFDRTRLRVSDLTKGAEVAWDASKFTAPFTFFDRAPDAPAPVAESDATIRSKPIREFDEKDAYFAALDRDTLSGYEDFLAAYPNDAMAKRVRAIVAARREAITWRETWQADTQEAYWSYLRRYPHGPHVWDARRRLTHFEAALEPPPTFAVIAYDVPPPPPPEVVYVEQPVIYFGDPDFGYAPPPPPIFLAPPPPEFVTLPPPPPPTEVYVLPEPVFVPVPQWVEPPRNVAPPENNIIFNDIHKTVINNVTIDNTTVNAPPAAAGQTTGQSTGLTTGQTLVGAAVLGAAGAAALHVALPPSVQKKAQHSSGKAVARAPVASEAVAAPAKPEAGNAAAHTLPGLGGKPLPQAGKLPPIAPQVTDAQPKPNQPNGAPFNKAQPNGTPAGAAKPNVAKLPLPDTTSAVKAPAAPSGRKGAHALPGADGQALPVAANPPQPKGHKHMAKAPAPQVMPNLKSKSPGAIANAPSFKPRTPATIANAPSLRPKAARTAPSFAPPKATQMRPAIARAPVNAQARAPARAPDVGRPPVNVQPHAAAPMVAHAPKIMPQAHAPQPAQAAPAKPQQKKPPCGAPGQPACHG
ncbi:caspase family protein [Pleomorphomonas oryzae]|uniref:caspase family protein n=1 Tax=Pleomorphomonas oryzae TaxID=261934 RepID=UPI00041C628B|nr:caspase family protein [Pleomorphomonas oryzae]